MQRGDPGYWEWRKNTGRKKAIQTPEELWEHACDYFKRVDSEPFVTQDFIRSGQKAGNKVDINNKAPYTWAGLEVYLFEKGIIQDLGDYKGNTDNRYSEFKGIVRAITRVIFERNFTGAAVNAFSPNLIARQLGLAESSKVEVTKEQPLFGEAPDSDTAE